MGWVVRRSEGKAVRGSCPDLLGGTAHPIHAAPARSVNPQRSAFIGVHRRPIIKALSQLEVLVSDGTLILAAELGSPNPRSTCSVSESSKIRVHRRSSAANNKGS